jgi:hypothetical protein
VEYDAFNRNRAINWNITMKKLDKLHLESRFCGFSLSGVSSLGKGDTSFKWLEP